MEERPGRIVLDENTGMLLWKYEDDRSCVPLEIYADRIYVTGYIPKGGHKDGLLSMNSRRKKG